MQEWQELFTGATTPTYRQVEEYINSSLWQKLNGYLREAYEVEPKMEYSGCSMQPGWNIKYRKSGKSLCTLYPMPDYFITLVVIGDREMHEAELLTPSCSDYVQSVFNNTQTGQGQKWLMIDVKDERTVDDVIKLIALRKRAKK